MSTTKKLLKRLVKLSLNLGKLLCKLLSHTTVKLINDANQRLFSLDKVIMLSLQKLITR